MRRAEAGCNRTHMKIQYPSAAMCSTTMAEITSQIDVPCPTSSAAPIPIQCLLFAASPSLLQPSVAPSAFYTGATQVTGTSRPFRTHPCQKRAFLSRPLDGRHGRGLRRAVPVQGARC